MAYSVLLVLGVGGCTLCVAFVILQAIQRLTFLADIYERHGAIQLLQAISRLYPTWLAVVALIFAVMAIVGISGLSR